MPYFEHFWVTIPGLQIESQSAQTSIDNYEIFDIYSYLYKFCKNLTIIFSTRSQCWVIWMIFGLMLFNQNYLNLMYVQCICDTYHRSVSDEFTKMWIFQKCVWHWVWKFFKNLKYFENPWQLASLAHKIIQTDGRSPSIWIILCNW